MNNLIEQAFLSSNCVISIIGSHAGEDIDVIFDRKKKDIEKVGYTFWLTRSYRAHPIIVQEMCCNGLSYVFFVSASTNNGSRATLLSESAKSYSSDGDIWNVLPEGIGPVTGKISSSSYALVLDQIEIIDRHAFDLWKYASFENCEKPVKFALGSSTLCAIKKDISSCVDKTKSRFRNVVAVGKLKLPYCVFLK